MEDPIVCKTCEQGLVAGLDADLELKALFSHQVHFFRPTPKEYLHSAELRDIMQFGSSSTAVFFKMRVAGILHIFQFETKQGEDICVALQTHINDVMLRRWVAEIITTMLLECLAWRGERRTLEVVKETLDEGPFLEL